MNRTRLLLGSALTLSLVALVSFVTKPRPAVAPRGTNVVAKQGALKLELSPSHTAVSTRGTEVFAELVVTLEGEAPMVKDAPVAMALVLDVSGSMSGQKLEDARRAAHRLVELLTERDELAVVSFGSDVQVFERRPVNEESRAFFHRAIDGLAASGSTNISGGVEAGWRALRGAGGGRRLVLVSDGQPTVGLVTHPELASLV
ncbi:MAG TPA: VWA domain-containing protein, partial [Archangium sp.]